MMRAMPDHPPSAPPPPGTSIVPATHARRAIEPDAAWELGLAQHLSATLDAAGLDALAGRHASGPSEFDRRMRRVLWRARLRSLGDGLAVGEHVSLKHPETMSVGAGVLIGDQACLHGRAGGHCVIGDRAWIGPQAFLDARDLELGPQVGIGPGARILGSTHTGLPADLPTSATDLSIRPVRIGAGANIGVNAVILPGVTVGAGAQVGAGAVVAEDVAPYAVVAGVPARFLHWREGYAPPGKA